MSNRNDGLAEILVQLAGNAATLIERARATTAMRAAQTVDAEAEPSAEEVDAQRAALQEIIVQQAMKLHQLEAQVATLQAELAALKQVSAKVAEKAARKVTKHSSKPATPAAG